MATVQAPDIEVRFTADTSSFVREMNRAERQTNSFRDSMKGLSRGVAAIDGPLGGISGRVSAMTSLVTSSAAAWTGLGAAVAGAGAILVMSIGANEQAERQLARLEAQINATGNAAGKTTRQLDEQARSLAMATLTSAEEVRDAQSILLGYTNVVGENFDRTIVLAQNLASVSGTLSEKVKQLGKSLDDPVRNLGALTEAGVTFTASQRRMVKALVDVNDVAGAQNVILSAIEPKYREVAEGAAATLTGSMDTLGQRWQEFLQQIDKTIGLTPLLIGALTGVAKAIQFITDALKDYDDLSLEELLEEEERLISKLELAKKGRGQAAAKGSLAEVQSLIKDIKAENEKAAQESAAIAAERAAERAAELQKEFEANEAKTQLVTDAAQKQKDAERERAASRYQDLEYELLGEEGRIYQHYQRLKEIVDEAEKTNAIQSDEAQEMRKELSIKNDEEIEDLRLDIAKKSIDDRAALAQEGLNLAKHFAEEGSKEARAIFAVEKGLAIGQATVALAVNVAKAASKGFPQNIPLIAAALAQGSVIMATLKGANIQGQADDGMTNVPRRGSYLLAPNERVLSPNQNQDLMNFMQQGKSQGISVNVHNYSGEKVSTSFDNDTIQVFVGAAKASIRDDVRRGVGIDRDMRQSYGLTRRGTV